MATKDDENAEARALGAALRVLRKRRQLSQPAAGDAFGISGEGWRKYEAGLAPSIFKPDTQRRLVAAVGATVGELMAALGDMDGRPAQSWAPTVVSPSFDPSRRPEASLLVVRDRVQAGAWLMADDHGQGEPATYPAIKDPRFARADQWMSEVVGDSVNALNIFDGDLVHCVDIGGLGYSPRTGDVVEVERLRFDGSERELTIKQVEVTPNGILLWPRSTNPRWRDPLELTSGTGEGEEIEVRLRGLVLASVRRIYR